MNVMAGVLPASMIIPRRLQALGYVEGEVVGGEPCGGNGQDDLGARVSLLPDCAQDARFAYRFTMGKGILDDKDGWCETRRGAICTLVCVRIRWIGSWGGQGVWGTVKLRGIERGRELFSLQRLWRGSAHR